MKFFIEALDQVSVWVCQVDKYLVILKVETLYSIQTDWTFNGCLRVKAQLFGFYDDLVNLVHKERFFFYNFIDLGKKKIALLHEFKILEFTHFLIAIGLGHFIEFPLDTGKIVLLHTLILTDGQEVSNSIFFKLVEIDT